MRPKNWEGTPTATPPSTEDSPAPAWNPQSAADKREDNVLRGVMGKPEQAVSVCVDEGWWLRSLPGWQKRRSADRSVSGPPGRPEPLGEKVGPPPECSAALGEFSSSTNPELQTRGERRFLVLALTVHSSGGAIKETSGLYPGCAPSQRPASPPPGRSSSPPSLEPFLSCSRGSPAHHHLPPPAQTAAGGRRPSPETRRK